jgi:hypothetical protein
MRAFRSLLLGLVVLAAGSIGCKDYTYYDVHVTFDAAGFAGTIGSVQACHMFVTGAETHDFDISDNTRACPPPNVGLDMGVWEYASLADSGQLTFTMKVYNKMAEFDSCHQGQAASLVGQGSAMVTLPAPMTTNPVPLTVTAVTPPACRP